MGKDKTIRCPWCGAEMEPVCEETRIRTGLIQKKTFYTHWMRCTECGARGPEIGLVLNQDEGMLAAAHAARKLLPDWVPHDCEGVVKPDRLPSLGVEEMDELAHLWHEAKAGRVSVWPVAPGAVYYHLHVEGEPVYTDEDELIGQQINVQVQRRIFRAGQTWGASDFRKRSDILEALEKRWPGIEMSAQLEKHDVRLDSGDTIQAEVANGNLEGETLVPDERTGITREQVEGPEN